jgi:glucokinase
VAQDSGFVIGIDFGGSKVAVASATLAGEILGQVRLETKASRGAEQAVRRGLAAAQLLIAQAEERTGAACVAAGAVSPGIVFPDRIALAPNVPDWEQLALRSRVQSGLGLDCVAVGNDVKAAGLAEFRWGELAGADTGLFLSLGTGVAAAVLIGGQVLNGAHNAAGEIGYSLCDVDDEAAFADGRAPLEEFAGGRFIGVRASKLAGRHLTAAEAFAAGDSATQKLVDHALDVLAVHLANIAILLDPQRIAVGGGMMASADRVLAALNRRLQRALPFPSELVRARFIHDAALRGAVALAIDAVAQGPRAAAVAPSASGVPQ